MNIRFLWLVVLVVLLQGCREGPTKVRLKGDFSLSSYEWNPENQYFIEQGGKVIIPPLVKSVAIQGNRIYGYLNWSEDSAFEQLPSGYFLIDTKSDEVTSGLGWNELVSIVPTAKKDQLKAPSEIESSAFSGED